VPDLLGDDAYREHVAPVWRYVRARLPSDADADDVTSDVFVRAMRSWEGFDSTRGSLRAWLVGVAHHAVADWWRHRREHPMEQPPEDRHADPEDDPEARVLRAAAADEVRSHLGMLSAREREAVALRFGAELSAAEVGEFLGVSPTAARMLVYRAVTKLREVLADD
jgi:RNA polymerase sigma factor (sigma-70 family)